MTTDFRSLHRRRRRGCDVLSLLLAGGVVGRLPHPPQARSQSASEIAGQNGPAASAASHRSSVPETAPARAGQTFPVPRLQEPSVEAICKAAVALALAEPERARSFITRARAAGWLPELHFRAYRRFARTEGLTFADMGTGTAAPVDVNAVDDVRYEWRASWDLSRMVFNPDELQAHFEGLRMADVRRDIQSLVIKLYFERRRLVLEADAAPVNSSTVEADRRFLRIAEVEAQLDALSGGAFSHDGGARGEAATSP